MCGGGLIHWLNNERTPINATKTDDTTSYVSVGEIWNQSTGQFDGNNLTTLLQYITNNAGVTSLDITAQGSLGDMLASNTAYSDVALSSAEIRTSTANGKGSGDDVQVTFGGLTWQVVYLTKDKQGNDILTLWLSNNKQEAWADRSATEGTLYGFIDGALYSDWSNNFYNASFTVTYPSSLYGASYIHAVTLNNGGTYATSTSAVTTNSPEQDSNSVFAMFTMNDVAGSVTKYLVTPREVAYQETESAVAQFEDSYYYPNEAYGEPNGSGSWDTSNGGAENITKNTYYDAWADDTLWLPSRTETGYSGISGSAAGIWQTSTSQRANNTGSDSSMGSVGTTSGTAYNYSWLRSGLSSYASYAYYLYASGSTYGNINVYYSYAVRPALHLNLNSAAQAATELTQPRLEDPSQQNSESNPYIIDTAEKLEYLSDNYEWAADKYFLQTENLDLNNHPWTPINNVTSTSSSNRRAYYYDGGGHTISNLYINTAEQTLNSNDRIGLFGYVCGSSSKHAYIKNLGIVGGSISGNNNVGAVVGYVYYTDITSCYNEGVSVTGSDCVGGVAGSNYSGTISNSYNEGIVTGTGTFVGGVVGGNYGTISDSYNIGDVTGDYEVGGVAGESHETISNSYNTGTVTGRSNVGGVAGRNEGTISNSYNTGVVTGTDNSVGGVAGNNYETISNSYNTGAVTGTNYVGGVAGYVRGSSSSPAVISGCYSTGAIIRSSGSETSFGGVVGYIENSSSCPAQYVSVSWCYYNEETSGSVVTKAIGRGNGYQCYGLTTTEMQGAQNENYMYLSSSFWNFSSGSYPTLKYVAKPA